MFSPTMRAAVFQATAIFAISLIFRYHITEHTFDKVMADEAFSGWWTMVETLALNTTHSLNMKMDASNPNGLRLTLDAADAANMSAPLHHPTATNGTSAAGRAKSFYRQTLPTELVVHLVIFVLQYWWFIGLERMLPARPRAKEAPRQRAEKIEMSEDREEEVVQKWIAQGKVQRASLSWCNTFLKWVLEMTLGLLWTHITGHVVRGAIELLSPKVIFAGLRRHLVYNFTVDYFSPLPLATLIAFVVVPAHKRIVFICGAELVASMFFHALVRTFAIRAVRTDFVQDMLRNMTELMAKADTAEDLTSGLPPYLRYDEL